MIVELLAVPFSHHYLVALLVARPNAGSFMRYTIISYNSHPLREILLLYDTSTAKLASSDTSYWSPDPLSQS